MRPGFCGHCKLCDIDNARNEIGNAKRWTLRRVTGATWSTMVWLNKNRPAYLEHLESQKKVQFSNSCLLFWLTKFGQTRLCICRFYKRKKKTAESIYRAPSTFNCCALRKCVQLPNQLEDRYSVFNLYDLHRALCCDCSPVINITRYCSINIELPSHWTSFRENKQFFAHPLSPFNCRPHFRDTRSFAALSSTPTQPRAWQPEEKPCWETIYVV